RDWLLRQIYAKDSVGYAICRGCLSHLLAKTVLARQDRASGEMAEWLKAHAWKACVRETVPWVRIPLSPPSHQPKVLSRLQIFSGAPLQSPDQSEKGAEKAGNRDEVRT